MKFAVPFTECLDLYRDNALTAPKFGIYSLRGNGGKITILMTEVVPNPLAVSDTCTFDTAMVHCSCAPRRREAFSHRLLHYGLLEILDGCDYLLANYGCDNLRRALAKGGIKVFHYASFIRQTDHAIKNFIIGASLADTVQHINHAS